MLRTQSSSATVRPVTEADASRALQICEADPTANVFVAARILDGALAAQPGALLGYGGDELRALCWTSANIVPVEADTAAALAFADRARGRRRRSCSVFGEAVAVHQMWDVLQRSWGRPRAIRARQPLMACTAADADVPRDERVRKARQDELDLVVPAAAAMFTEEIGYPPYVGSPVAYRQSVAALIAKGHTFVRVDNGELVFKADVGSAAIGVAQIQGVWVAPRWRGRGLAVPAMAAVVDLVRAEIAPTVTLYVNDFNMPARRTYERVGFAEVGTFATVLL